MNPICSSKWWIWFDDNSNRRPLFTGHVQCPMWLPWCCFFFAALCKASKGTFSCQIKKGQLIHIVSLSCTTCDSQSQIQPCIVSRTQLTTYVNCLYVLANSWMVRNCKSYLRYAPAMQNVHVLDLGILYSFFSAQHLCPLYSVKDVCVFSFWQVLLGYAL